MPKSDDGIVNKQGKVLESSNDKTEKTSVTKSATNSSKNNRPYLIAGGIILVLIILVAALGSLRLLRPELTSERRGVITYGQQSMMPHHNQNIIIQSSSSNNTSNIFVSGVVTSVSGNNFVIAGNGVKYTVNTSGDTTYNTTDKKVSENDSVMVIGTKSNTTITATDIRIVNF